MSKRKPDFSSRGIAVLPPKPSTAPRPPEVTPPVGDGIPFDYNKKTSVPFAAPPQPPPPPPVVEPAVLRSFVPPIIEPPASNYSANLETFSGVGEPYFALAATAGSNWSEFPATQAVDMSGFDISGIDVVRTQIVTATFIESIDIQANGIEVLNYNTTPGKIELFDNNGVAHVLESINGELYFDTQLLAKANDLQDIADWSNYPALFKLDMNKFSIDNINSTRFNNDVDPPHELSIGPTNLLLDGQPIVAGTVVTSIQDLSGAVTVTSTGGTLAVTQPTATNTINIDISGSLVRSLNDLSGAVVLSTTSLKITELSGSEIAIDLSGGVVSTIQDLSGAITLTASTSQITFTTTPPGTIDLKIPPNTFVDSLNSQKGTVNLASAGNTVLITTPSAGTVNLEVSPSGAGVASLNTLAGAVTLASSDTTVSFTNSSPTNINVQSSAKNWAQFVATQDVDVGQHGITIRPTSLGYPNSQLDSNINIGKTTYLVYPDFTAYVANFQVGSIASPTTSASIASIGSIDLTSAEGVNVTGGGGISITGGLGLSIIGGGDITMGSVGAITAIGSTITLGTGLLSILGGIINVGTGLLNILGGNIAVGAGAIEVGTGNITIGVASTPGGNMTVYGGKIISSPTAPGNGGIEVTGSAQLKTNALVPGDTGALVVGIPGNTTTDHITLDNIQVITSRSSTMNINGVANINGSPYPPPPGNVSTWSTFPATQDVSMNGHDLVNVNTMVNGTESIQLDSITGVITMRTDSTVEVLGNLLVGVDATFNGQANLFGTTQVPDTASFVLAGPLYDNTTSKGTFGQVLTSDPTAGSQGGVRWTTITPLVLSFDIYVAPNGSNTTGTGSLSKPYQTITKALAVRATIAATSIVSILIGTGTYTEDVVCGVNNTNLIGFGLQGQTTIVGNVSFSVASTGAAVSGAFQGINIVNGVLTYACLNLGQTHSFTVTSVNIGGNQTGTVFAMTNANVAQSVSIVCNGLAIQGNSATAPLISITSCRPLLIQSVIINTGLASCIGTLGTGTFGLFGTTISSTSSSTAVLPLINVGNTVSPGGVGYSIQNCFLTYVVNTAVNSSANKQCIACNNGTGVAVAFNITNTQMLCEGSASLNAGAFYNVMVKPGAGTCALSHYQNYGGASANKYAATITKTAWLIVS